MIMTIKTIKSTIWESTSPTGSGEVCATIKSRFVLKEEEKGESNNEISKNYETGGADKYLFEVRRYKDRATKEEFLNIQVYEITMDIETGKILSQSKEVYAEIERATIVELEAKLLNLRIYGVVMERKNFPKIRQLIEKIYSVLPIHYVEDSDKTTDNVISEIYMMFVRYIKELGIAPENGLYNIPVTEFKEYLEDTKYNKYKYSDIKAGLANFSKEINGEKKPGTKCSFGRNDNTIKEAKGDKRIKVISFLADVVDSYQITELPEA